MQIKTLLILGLLLALGNNLQGQNIKKNNLIGVWSDKNFLDSLKSHNSLTLAFEQRGKLYNGLYIKNDTLIQALYPRAMEEDWLYYNTENNQYQNSRGAIKIIEVINDNLIKTTVDFYDYSGIKYFIKVIPNQQAIRTDHALQLHFQRLYRMWFAGQYDIVNSKGHIISSCLFTEQGNAEGLIDNSLYTFFLWDTNNAVLNLENWKTKLETYYILTHKDSLFSLEEVNEPKWTERPTPLIKTGKKIILQKSH